MARGDSAQEEHSRGDEEGEDALLHTTSMTE